MFNVSEIIHSQIPDRQGNIIPATVHEGSATISGIHAENETILVAVDAGTYNVRKATCSWYCISCSGVTTMFVSPSPFAVATSGTKQLVATARWNTGAQYTYTTYSTWSSNRTTVATVSNTTQGLVTGVSAGSATITASFTGTEIYNPNLCAYDPRCPASGTVQGSGPGGVGPYQVEPIFTASQGPVTAGNCPNSPYPGFVRFVTNQVQYQNGTAFAFSGLSVADTITVGTRHDLGSGTDTGSAVTTGDGSFQDRYSVCSPLCPGSGGQTDALQNWTVNGVPLPHVNGLVYKCTSITIDGR